MNDRISTFAGRLTLYMSQNDIKAVDLSKRLNVSRSTISQWVNGSVVPKRDRLVELSDVLHINPLWLMGYDVPLEPQNLVTSDLTQDESHIIEAYRNASEDTKTAVRAVLGVKKGIVSKTDNIIV